MKPRVLFVHQALMSFVQTDLKILRSKYEVREVRYRGLRDIFSLLRGVFWCDVTFTWFGSIHAFFTVLFSKTMLKKAIVVAGGYDVATAPEIRYGMFSFWWKRWCPLFVFKYADVVLTVSDNNTNEAIINAKVDPQKIRRIYHGFDPEKFRNKISVKEDMVITVGAISWEYLKRKGIELFVRAASGLPEIPFYVIGTWKDDSIKHLKRIASANVHFLGRLSDEDLESFMNKSKVYVQVSLHEAFGCALAEAMLCECIPVVSQNAAIPEVVGDAGIYIDEAAAENVAEKIKFALKLSREHSVKARNRILENFLLNTRKEKILETVDSILH